MLKSLANFLNERWPIVNYKRSSTKNWINQLSVNVNQCITLIPHKFVEWLIIYEMITIFINNIQWINCFAFFLWKNICTKINDLIYCCLFLILHKLTILKMRNLLQSFLLSLFLSFSLSFSLTKCSYGQQ